MKLVSKKRQFLKKIILGIIVFSLIIVFFNIFQKNTRNFFYLISSPIQKIFWQIGDKTSDFFEIIINIKGLKKEVNELRAENQELLYKIISLEELKKENEGLKQALNVGLEKEFELEFAKIIGKDITRDYVLINKGLEDGIKNGFPVISSQKTLLGRVDEVYENFSRVILISDAKSAFDAKVQNKEIYGVVKGKGNLNIFFDLIPLKSEIETGDVLITSTMEGVFPKGLLVGTIKEVKKGGAKPFQTAEIESFFNLKEIDSVFIITNYLKQ